MTAMKRFSGDKPEKRGSSKNSPVEKPGRSHPRDERDQNGKDYERGGDRPSYRKPFSPRSNDGQERKPWSKDSSSDNKRSYAGSRNRQDGDKPYERSERKPWSKDSSFDNKRSYAGSRSRQDGDKPYERTERKPWSKDSSSDSRRPYEGNRSRQDGDKPYERTERKPWSKDSSSDSRRPYEGNRSRQDGDKPYERTERKPWSKDSSSDSRRPYEGNRSRQDNDRPYKKRTSEDGERSEYKRPSYRDNDSNSTPRQDKWRSNDKPDFREKRGDDTRRSGYGDRRRDQSEQRPYERKNFSSDEKRSYRKPDSEGYTKKPYRSNESGDDSSYKRPSYKSNDRAVRSGSFKQKDWKKSSKSSNPNTENDGTIRLNKYIANSGVCSRREADDMIQAGAITVNGVVVTELGTKITDTDKVQIGNETLNPQKKVYLLLNKPKGYITTVDDPQDRNTVMMLVNNACRERIYPVGRLDRNTSGLLLFTNDGELAKKLTHPSHKVRKIYHVEVNRAFSKADMIRMTEGIELEDGIMAVDEIAYTGSGEDKKTLGVVIHSGKNRIVRRLFEALDYEITKLDRVAFANLTKKDLPRGRHRFLEESEISMLKML